MSGDLLALQAIAEADEAGLRGPSPAMALHETLDAAVASLVAAEGGDRDGAEAKLWEAHVAAADAFPWDSPESEALGIVLGAVSSAARERAA